MPSPLKGHIGVQWAKRKGCKVIGLCSTAQKAAFLHSIGCDRVINYKEDSVDAILSAEFPVKHRTSRQLKSINEFARRRESMSSGRRSAAPCSRLSLTTSRWAEGLSLWAPSVATRQSAFPRSTLPTCQRRFASCQLPVRVDRQFQLHSISKFLFHLAAQQIGLDNRISVSPF